MPIYFLDSSALVKGYRNEPGTPRIQELLAGIDPLVIARLAHLEVSSAIVRRGRDAQLPPDNIRAVLDELDREILKSFLVIDLSSPILANAIHLTRVHALRGADAIQLACALATHRRASAEAFIIVSSDQELNAAAVTEGLSVLDPTKL